MSTQSADHSKSGPAIGLGDPATERDKLIAANYAFAAALNVASSFLAHRGLAAVVALSVSCVAHY